MREAAEHCTHWESVKRACRSFVRRMYNPRIVLGTKEVGEYKKDCLTCNFAVFSYIANIIVVPFRCDNRPPATTAEAETRQGERGAEEAAAAESGGGKRKWRRDLHGEADAMALPLLLRRGS